MKSSLSMAALMITSQRWIAHPGHIIPAWTTAMRRELVAAFRRGSMNAERCLRTYLNQGEPEMLPFEAVVFLAARVAAECSGSGLEQGSTESQFGGEALFDQGEDELAELCLADREEFEGWIEAGRRFFFPRCQAIG